MAVAMQQAFPEDAAGQSAKPLEVVLLTSKRSKEARLSLKMIGLCCAACHGGKTMSNSCRVTIPHAIFCRLSCARELYHLRENQPFQGVSI